jgi:hypothetical protein
VQRFGDVLYLMFSLRTGDSSLVHNQKQNFHKFLWNEITGGYLDKDKESRFVQTQEDVYNFVNVPFQLEKVILFGFFICLDAFLFMFSFFPIRVLIAAYTLIAKLFNPRY